MNYSSKVCHKFIPMFRNLEELDISLTRAGDECLHMLGTYCRDLR